MVRRLPVCGVTPMVRKHPACEVRKDYRPQAGMPAYQAGNHRGRAVRVPGDTDERAGRLPCGGGPLSFCSALTCGEPDKDRVSNGAMDELY